MPRRRPRSDDSADLLRRRTRLLQRIHRRFATITETLEIGALTIDFTRIADPDVVLDEVAAEEALLDRLHGKDRPQELHLPYWAQLWDSALGVGRWLAGHLSAAERPLQVLDLGCGMGLAGTVAARLGCHVTFADLEPAALLFAALNSLPDRPRVRTIRLNWQTDRLAGRYDIILGADILYERGQWPHLERFWREHLAAGGKVVLGEPGRQTGELFLGWIRDSPWTVRESQQPVATRERPIRVLTLTAC